jgi:hypothetical protein
MTTSSDWPRRAAAIALSERINESLLEPPLVE